MKSQLVSVGKVVSGVAAVLAPKCFLCTTAYAGAIAVCGLAEPSQSDIVGQASVGVSFFIAIWAASSTSRFAIWKMIPLWVGFLFFAFSELVYESEVLFYLGITYYMIGTLLLGGLFDKLYFMLFRRTLSTVEIIPSETENL